MIATGLEAAGEQFEARRQLGEELDLQATVSAEGGYHIALVMCALDEERVTIVSITTGGRNSNGTVDCGAVTGLPPQPP